MSKNAVLVLGTNGQLGRALQLQFANARFFDRAQCDLTSEASLEALPWGTFNVLINAAAYTAVDQAETTEGASLAQLINADAPATLARLSQQHDVTLVHISSDYVFDGTQATPYSEADVPSPLGIYGKTKLQGDLAVQKMNKHYILRTSWVIGDGSNFVKTMATLASKGIEPSVVNDQIGRLTFTTDLAVAIRHLLESHAPFGTYNVTNEGPATHWANIAREVFSLAGFDPRSVTVVSTEDYFSGKEGIAPRPLNSVLDLTKIEATGFTPEDWRVRLQEYVSTL